MKPSTASAATTAEGLPRDVGLGLRHEHASAWLDGKAGAGFAPAFAEIHAENYMMEGGPALDLLDRIAERYPLSIHGVALSLAGEDALDTGHLAALKRLIERYQPASFSEHLAWSSHAGVYFNDLLPVAYTGETLARVARRIDQAQAALGVRLLLENPSSYLRYDASDWDEVDFLTELARRTGCGLLLDVNNVAVSAHNAGFDAQSYIDRFPLDLVGEIHIAGHDAQWDGAGQTVLIDGHGSPVSQAVWNLLDRVLEHGGPRPVLLERDNNVPPPAELIPELSRAARMVEQADAPIATEMSHDVAA